MAPDAPSPWTWPSAPSLLELHETSKRISPALLEVLNDTSVCTGSAESWAFPLRLSNISRQLYELILLNKIE